MDLTRDDIVRFLSTKRDELARQARARRGFADASLHTTDDEEERACQMAERVSGRHMPRTSFQQRQENARRDLTIAQKCDAEVEAYHLAIALIDGAHTEVR